MTRLRTKPALSSGGEAVGQLPDGRVVFVVGAAPDETVEIELVQDNKRFARARTVRVIEPSPHRVPPRCPLVEACGGCTLQHVAAEKQTESKHLAVLEALRRIGGVSLEGAEIDLPWSGAPYGYRTRARIAVGPGPVVGFRREGGREIVDVERCEVLSIGAQAALTTLRAVIDAPRAVDEVDLVASGGAALARLPNRLARAAKKAPVGPVEILEGRTRKSIAVHDGQGPLRVAPGVFSQSNAEGNAAMVAYAAGLVPEGTGSLLELYAGSGNFTRALVSRAARIVAVESEEPALRLAEAVLPDSVGLEARLAEDALAEHDPAAFDAVLVDPPRAGLSDAARARLSRAKRLIYVSCNPATFARDLAALGLPLRRLRVFDLYPQTPHAELVALLAS